MLSMELCLGTVQFGMDYGIQGGRKPSKEKIFEMLDYAAANGVTLLDTAYGYGDAQHILGEYNAKTSNRFHIISKLSKDLFQNTKNEDYTDRVRQNTEDSLKDLMLPRLTGLLFHNPKDLYDNKAVKALHRMKEEGLTEYIGVSVYQPLDAYYALQQGLDMIQLPVNLFDRSFEEFLDTCTSSVKLLARSVYLQGLLLMEPDRVSQRLPAAVKYVKLFDQLCKEYHYSKQEIAMAYLKQKKGINAVLFGVDHITQLKENLNAIHKQVPEAVVYEIAGHFAMVEEEVSSPLNWNKYR